MFTKLCDIKVVRLPKKLSHMGKFDEKSRASCGVNFHFFSALKNVCYNNSHDLHQKNVDEKFEISKIRSFDKN